MEFLKTKIDILEHALAATAGAYYSINLTKNIVPGLMYQVIDDKEYILNDHIGLPENARFSDVVTYWGNKLDDSEKKAYFEFLDIQNLLKLFNVGKTHVFHQYWTKTALFEPMLAKQHIVMYEDHKNHDVLAITYVLDKTQKFKDNQHRNEYRK